MQELVKQLKRIFTNKIFLSLIMACFTYSTICLSGIVLTYNTISWFLFFALIILFLKTNIFNKQYKKEILSLSILFSFIIIYGTIAYSIQDSIETSIFRELIQIKSIFYFIGIFNLIYIILTNVFPKLSNYKIEYTNSRIKNKYIVFIISFAVILISWMPYFLALYPGTLTPDSLNELGTIIDKFTFISDHHPVAHILFVALPYNIGFKLSGTITIGVAFATVFQMIMLAMIFSLFIVFLYNRKVNDKILLIVLLFYAIVPMHGYYSIVMWKDVMFSGILLLLTMELVKIIEKEKDGNLNFKNLLSFILISIFCVFFRNNAIYMYFLLAIVTLFVFKKYYKIFLISFAIIFGIYFIVKGPIFNYFNISKSASAEYIGMPLQQIGRMAYKKVKFTKEEKELINKLMPIDIMAEAYNPKVSDGIKFNKAYNAEQFDNNKSDYFKLWLSLIIKHPSVAIEAYSISTLGYWYPGVEYWSVAEGIWNNDYGLEIEPKGTKLIQSYVANIDSRRAPILNMQWSIGLCFWIILIFGILTKRRKKFNLLYVFTPVIGIWLTMMIASPVFGEFRYVYGAYTCLPLLMLLPYINLKKNK